MFTLNSLTDILCPLMNTFTINASLLLQLINVFRSEEARGQSGKQSALERIELCWCEACRHLLKFEAVCFGLG